MFLAVFLLAYAPGFLTPYAFSDAYYDLAVALQGDESQLIAAGLRITQGHPLHALLLDGISLPAVGDIDGLRYLRLVGIVGIAVLAWNVSQLLVRTGRGQVQSFFMAVVMGTTLPFQVYAAWAPAAFCPYAALASGLAFTLAERAMNKGVEQGRLPKGLLGAGASLALLTSLTIHQSAAMFFWVIALASALSATYHVQTYFVWLRRFGSWILCALSWPGRIFLRRGASTWSVLRGGIRLRRSYDTMNLGCLLHVPPGLLLLWCTCSCTK